MRRAYAILISSLRFVAGMRVLVYSLRANGCKDPIVILCTGEKIADFIYRDIINVVTEITVRVVPPIDHPLKQRIMSEIDHISMQTGLDDTYQKNIIGLLQSRMRVFDKLNFFHMADYDIVISMDADMLVVKNIDELFGCQTFACCHDIDDTFNIREFNSGLMVIHPQEINFHNMLEALSCICKSKDAVVTEGRLFCYSDQDFLSDYFDDKWIKLSPVYNCLSNYLIEHPLFVREVRVIHYIGIKPWHIEKRNEQHKVMDAWYKAESQFMQELKILGASNA